MEKGKILKTKKYPYVDIRINTEEIYTGLIDEKRPNILRSIFTGESTEFLLRLFKPETSSAYFEIIPPKNTIISKVISGIKPRNFNIMMEDFSKVKNNSINFIDDFDERLVIHIPRTNKEKKEGKDDRGNVEEELEQYPRLFMTIRPFKTLQSWILASIVLGLAYNGFLIYLLVSICLNSICFQDIVFSDFLTSIIDIVKYQGPWIYGLLIGNQLWLQRPRFLWKTTTKLSIGIITIGAILLIFIIIYNNFLIHYVILYWI